MKFYRGNTKDEVPFDIPAEEVVAGYLTSKWAGYPWPISRAINAFLIDTDGPVNAAWADPNEFDALINAVLDAQDRKTP